MMADEATAAPAAKLTLFVGLGLGASPFHAISPATQTPSELVRMSRQLGFCRYRLKPVPGFVDSNEFEHYRNFGRLGGLIIEGRNASNSLVPRSCLARIPYQVESSAR